MSFGGDSMTSNMMQGATKSGGFGTLLGSTDDATGAGSLRAAAPIQGKKLKGRSPSASFLGQEATPMAGGGRTTLLGSAA